jgi:5-oxoprolinase (ATP-hydrolysing) subunit C
MALVVVDPGLSTTVQDAGRFGYRQWGVPCGGAFDRRSAELANALVGNGNACAVLELTLVGGTYRALGPLALALAGAPMEAKVLGPNAEERSLVLPLSFSLQEGEQLVLGRTLSGARTYLAVRGGWQTPLRLLSRSTEERLQSGEVLPANPGSIPTRHTTEEAAWKSPVEEPFQVLSGPDGGLVVDFDQAFWTGRWFHVGSRSNRMGLRLQGDPVGVISPPDRLSTPVAPGAIQVAGGQLIVLGVACGTMGGYPHVLQVISADLDRLGQLRPGDAVTFRPVALEEARSIDQTARQVRGTMLRRLATMVDDV